MIFKGYVLRAIDRVNGNGQRKLDSMDTLIANIWRDAEWWPSKTYWYLNRIHIEYTTDIGVSEVVIDVKDGAVHATSSLRMPASIRAL